MKGVVIGRLMTYWQTYVALTTRMGVGHSNFRVTAKGSPCNYVPVLIPLDCLLASEILLTYSAQLSISADNHMIYGNEWALSYIRMLVSY